MMAIRSFLSVSTLVAALVGLPSLADAQTRAKATSMAAKPVAAASWKCASKTVELAQVSEDTTDEAGAWVMVHRVKGEIIAAERVSQKEIEQIRKLPCAGDALDRPPPLMG